MREIWIVHIYYIVDVEKGYFVIGESSGLGTINVYKNGDIKLRDTPIEGNGLDLWE